MNWGDGRLPERFWAKVQPCPMSGCWLWVGATGRRGYGITSFKRRNVPAHRAAYTKLVGEIVDGLVIDHKCKVTCCVNPAHLEPVTQQVNVQRGTSFNGTKTECHRGHPFNETNTYRHSKGRQCRACRSEYVKAWRRSNGRKKGSK